MRKLYLIVTLTFLILVFCVFLFWKSSIGHYRDFICRADVSKMDFYDKEGRKLHLKGRFVFDLRHNSFSMSLYNSADNSFLWRGAVSFKPEYNFRGRLYAITIDEIHPGMSSINISKKTGELIDGRFAQGLKFPLHIYRVNEFDRVYLLKSANSSVFCIAEKSDFK